MRLLDMTRMGRVAALLLALALVLAACGGGGGGGGQTSDGGETGTPAGEPEPATDGDGVGSSEKVLTIGLWSSPGNFSPINADSSYAYYVVGIVYDTLVAHTPELTFEPRLAEDWEVSEDATQITFHLNPNARFHDGQPVTAEDVAYTIQVIAHPEAQTNRGASLGPLVGLTGGKTPDGGPVEGVEVLDEHTIRFTFEQPVDMNFVLETLGTSVYVMPKHLVENVPVADLGTAAAFADGLIGSGPFKFVRYVTDQFVELEKNPDYHVAEPKLDRIVLRITSPTAMVAALRTGDIDMGAGQGIGEVPLQDWPTVQQMDGIVAKSFLTIGYQYMLINNEKPYFQDPRAKRAITHAVNRQLIVDQLLQGEGVVAVGPISPIVEQYYPDHLEPLAYDPDLARQLLDEAGRPDGPLTLLVPTGNEIRVQSAALIQADLQAIGLTVNIETVDFPTVIARSQSGDYDFALLGWSSLFDPDVASQYATGGQYNFQKYSNPEVDRLLAQAVVTPDPDDRRQLYHRVYEIFQEDPPVVFLYFNTALTAQSERIVYVDNWAKNLPQRPWLWEVR